MALTTQRCRLVILLYAFIITVNPTVSENYIQGPHDLNISVGETATFTCEFNFTIQHTLWYLNYTPVQHFSVLNVQEYLHISAKDNLITSEISFLASSEAEPILNNSLLLCQGISSADNIYAVSQPAKLMLQGVLEAPSNLTTIFVHDSLLLQWIRPYTLSGVEIKGYFMQAFTPGDHNTDVGATFENGTGQDVCMNYEVCLQAVTAAGLGNETCVNSSRRGVLGSLYNRYVEMMVFVDSNATSLFYAENSSCSTSNSTKPSLDDFVEEEEFDAFDESAVVTHFHDSYSLILNLSLPTTANGHYITTYIALENITEHIVNVSFTTTEEGVEFQCEHAEYSTTSECVVRIECHHDANSSHELVIQRGHTVLLTYVDLNCSLLTIYGFSNSSNVTNHSGSEIVHNVTLDYSFLLPSSTPTDSLVERTSYASVSPTQLKPSVSLTQSQGRDWILIVTLSIVDIAIVLSMCVSVTILFIYSRKKHKKVNEECNTSKQDTVSLSDVNLGSELSAEVN